MFRIYKVPVGFNETVFSEVWIDPHYEQKHGESVNDELILELLTQLGHQPQIAQDELRGFQFYEVDLSLHRRSYRLILVVPKDKSYLGVRNAYRRVIR